MTSCNVCAIVHVCVQEADRLDLVRHKLAITFIRLEAKGEVWHLISQLLTRSEEVTPIHARAGDWLVWIRAHHILLEFLKLLGWHSDEWIARVDQSWLLALQDVATVELHGIKLDVPVSMACRVDPSLLVAGLEQVFIVSTESNRGGVLSRIVHMSVHAKLPFGDHAA